MAIDSIPAKPGQSRAQLYTWQAWVHVGPEAENCEDIDEEAGTNECRNPLHFHAWVRLPNAHQQRDIRERALAAKARRMRLMREEGSDLNVIFETDIERLAVRGEAVRAEITEELVSADWWRYVLDAQREMMFQTKEDSEELRWEHLGDDNERMKEIRALHADAQPKEELAILERRYAEYEEEFERLRSGNEQPVRDELAALDISQLIDRLRDHRIAQEGSDTFEHTKAEWELVTCTHCFPEGPLVFADVKMLSDQPTSVLDQLEAAFKDLNAEKGGLASGNS